jgi:hypothetical protein
MEIKELKNRTRFENEKIGNCYQRFFSLIKELRSQKLSGNVVSLVNEEIDLINSSLEEKPLRRQVFKSQQKIIKLIEKEHKIVPKNYYRNLWMVLGMTVFGLPFGAAFGTAIGNMAFLGLGMPIGMAIGVAIGAKKDKEAVNAGRQLNFEAKY